MSSLKFHETRQKWLCTTHCVLSSSWMSFSRSLKQPSEQIELRMSVSTTEIDGMTCVCTTSIIGSSSSSSLLPPAVTHGCLLISESCNREESSELDSSDTRDAHLPSTASRDSPRSCHARGSGSRAARSAVCEKRRVSPSRAAVLGYRRRMVEHQLVRHTK
jgi:hypothetical protein